MSCVYLFSVNVGIMVMKLKYELEFCMLRGLWVGDELKTQAGQTNVDNRLRTKMRITLDHTIDRSRRTYTRSEKTKTPTTFVIDISIYT